MAAAQYAPSEELMLLADALSMWDAVDDEQRAAVGGRAALLERAAQIAWVLGDLARACQWADEALAQAPTDDPRRRSTLLTLRAKVSPDWASPRVGDLLTEAVELARPGEPSPELAQALMHQAVWHSMRGEEAAAERGAHALIDVGIAAGVAAQPRDDSRAGVVRVPRRRLPDAVREESLSCPDRRSMPSR